MDLLILVNILSNIHISLYKRHKRHNCHKRQSKNNTKFIERKWFVMPEEYRLKLSKVQEEIDGLKLLNIAYNDALERVKEEYTLLCKGNSKNLAKLKETKKTIFLINQNIMARNERIKYLKTEEKWLKENIEKNLDFAQANFDRKEYKPEEFWQESKYI